MLIIKYIDKQINKFPFRYHYSIFNRLSLRESSNGQMNILILNGPNLNLLGFREPHIYGTTGFSSFFDELCSQFPSHTLFYIQSNHEGELIDQIQLAKGSFDAIIINPGGFAHTSVALADALRMRQLPVIEVHISNIFAREYYRQQMLTAAACSGCITGFGLKGYRIAVESLINGLIAE